MSAVFSGYNVWHHRIRKPPFLSTHTQARSRRFQKSSLWKDTSLVMVLTWYVWIVRQTISIPIRVDEALITNANYLHLRPLPHVLQVIGCMMYDIIVIEISVFVRPNEYDKSAFVERTPRLWGPFSKIIRNAVDPDGRKKNLHFLKYPDTCG